MVRKALVLAGVAVFLAGCAKKQVVRPSEDAAAQQRQQQQQQPAEAEQKEEASVRYSDWQTIPELETVYFPYDSSELTPEARQKLQANAEYLKDNSDLLALVEGHTDERGTTEYNLALGQRRAASVRDYYTNLGVDAARIGTISYGEEDPAVQGTGESAWTQNRRVVTKVRSK